MGKTITGNVRVAEGRNEHGTRGAVYATHDIKCG
jgi:hypothetical protein